MPGPPKPAGTREVIPLFPLGTVLVPGLPLPLHVFEPRYRQLVRDLQARPEGERGFGVVAIREGHEVGDQGVTALHEVGTLARLLQVLPYEDGRSDLLTRGGSRFRLVRLVDEGTPYHCAEVEWLAEDGGDEPTAQRLADATRHRFDAYRAAVSRAGAVEAAQMLTMPTDPSPLSYLVAVATVLDLADRQRLLEAPTAVDRLRLELALLAREAALLEHVPSLPAVELARTPTTLN